MELQLFRKNYTDKTTIGELSVNGVFECYTLEDVEREYPNKIPKETAIWPGKYKVVIDWSNRFQRKMPHVLDVPMFEGIRIHSGNTSADTEGCILVGTIKGNNAIYQSRIAFEKLYQKLADAKDDITIEIISCRVTEDKEIEK